MSFVYLLTPVHPSHHSKRTYIGKSDDPHHRLRQHNGEIVGGAVKTSRHRPWELVCIVSGFKTPRDALRFEWMWQHPYKSKLSRDLLNKKIKGKRGVGLLYCVKRKLSELEVILTLEDFSELSIEML